MFYDNFSDPKVSIVARFSLFTINLQNQYVILPIENYGLLLTRFLIAAGLDTSQHFYNF